jgi:hypothetical protein
MVCPCCLPPDPCSNLCGGNGIPEQLVFTINSVTFGAAASSLSFALPGSYVLDRRGCGTWDNLFVFGESTGPCLRCPGTGLGLYAPQLYILVYSSRLDFIVSTLIQITDNAATPVLPSIYSCVFENHHGGPAYDECSASGSGLAVSQASVQCQAIATIDYTIEPA